MSPRIPLALIAIACAACEDVGPSPGPTAPTLDLTDVGSASLFVPYLGQIALRPSTPASFALVGGALPDGLTLREDGAVSGTPSWLGEFNATVRAAPATGAALEGGITIVVEPGDQSVAPGFPRLPFATEQGVTLLKDPWVRVAGGGEGGQDSVVLDLGWYLPGPDGVADAGAGDDERVGDMDADDAQVAIGQWIPSAETPADPPVYPSAHRNDGSPPGWDPVTRRFSAGSDTGRRAVTVMAEGFDAIQTRLLVVPPDWCPKGVHPRGGPSPGVCE